MNECCVKLEVGDWNVCWAGLKDRCWIRESSLLDTWELLLDTWEFVAGYVSSLGGGEQNRWSEVRWIGERRWGERQWRVVIKREVDSYDVAWCRTWRGVRLNVTEREVERGVLSGRTWCAERKNVMTRWLQTWITELCFTRLVLLSWTRSCVYVTFYCFEVTDVRRTDMP